MAKLLRPCLAAGALVYATPALANFPAEGYAYCSARRAITNVFSYDSSLSTKEGTTLAELSEDYARKWPGLNVNYPELIVRLFESVHPGQTVVSCDIFPDLAEAQRRHQLSAEYMGRGNRVLEKLEFGSVKLSDQKGPLHAARVPWVAPNGPQFGYEAASISISYQFLTCADEITLAYAIDPKSVEVSDEYRLLTSRNEIEQTLSNIAEVPEPPAVRLDGHIKGKDPVAHARWPLPAAGIPFQDQFAGPALGFGCFTGQTQRVGMIKDLAGSDAGPERIKSLIDDLRLEVRAGDGPLRNATLESRATEHSALPEVEAPGPAQAEAERLAREQAEADDLAERWAEHERESQKIFERAEAERKALQEAQEHYEREMAAKRAADEQYARDMAAHEAELQRLAAERAEYERKLAEYRELVANRR